MARSSAKVVPESAEDRRLRGAEILLKPPATNEQALGDAIFQLMEDRRERYLGTRRTWKRVADCQVVNHWFRPARLPDSVECATLLRIVDHCDKGDFPESDLRCALTQCDEYSDPPRDDCGHVKLWGLSKAGQWVSVNIRHTRRLHPDLFRIERVLVQRWQTARELYKAEKVAENPIVMLRQMSSPVLDYEQWHRGLAQEAASIAEHDDYENRLALDIAVLHTGWRGR